MAIVLLDLYQSDNGRWFARLQNDVTGQIAELSYAAKPTAAQARADIVAVFNPPTVNVTAEDGTVLAAPIPQGFAINLTAGQRTAVANALTTVNLLAGMVSGKLSNLTPQQLALLRSHSPLLDQLLTIRDQLS